MTNEQLIFYIYGSNCDKYIYIYICGTWGPFNNHSGPILLLSSPFTNVNLHVKMYDFCCSCLGGPRGPFAESKVPKYQRIKTSSQWRHMYNKENDQLFIYRSRCATMNNFGYLGDPGNAGGRTSIIGLGLSLCASIISFMFIYMSNMEALLIKILNMKNMVFCRMLWAESRGTKMPTNADLIILETYVQ